MGQGYWHCGVCMQGFGTLVKCDYKKKRNHYEVFCLFHEYLERFFSLPNTGIKSKDAVLKITWTPL